MTGGEFTQAELFDVLSNARRRRTVKYLKRQHGSCDLAPLVEQVAAWENNRKPSEVTRTQRRRVYISLYQTHLPMLEDHGIVNWDPDSHTIELLPNEAVFDPYLETRPDEQRDWHYVYAAVTATGLLTLAVAWAFGPTAAPFIALGLCLAILAVAVFQHRSRTTTLSPFFGTRG